MPFFTEPFVSRTRAEKYVRSRSVSGRLVVVLLVLFACLSGVDDVHAQEDRKIGVGVELGTETGVTLKLHADRRIGYELLAAWNVGDWVFLNGHAVYSKALEENPRVKALYGFGAYIGAYESKRNRSGTGFLGLSARGAVVYALERYEAYFHLTPRFDLVPSTNFHLGGGLGFRVFI